MARDGLTREGEKLASQETCSPKGFCARVLRGVGRLSTVDCSRGASPHNRIEAGAV